MEMTLVQEQAKSNAPPLVQFVLPPELEATAPAELRGLRRDAVRLMVLPRANGEPLHTRFDALGDFLRAGDLLVVRREELDRALVERLEHRLRGAAFRRHE